MEASAGARRLQAARRTERHAPVPCLDRHITTWLYSVMSTAWSALADPRRRQVLELLRERPRAVGELVDHLGLSQPATSKHLRVLREAGLVRARARAQQRVYRVNATPLAELDAWLTPYRRLWETRLDALERHLDRTTQSDSEEEQ